MNDGNMADFKSPLDWLYANEAMNEGRGEGGGGDGGDEYFHLESTSDGFGSDTGAVDWFLGRYSFMARHDLIIS